jgi:hypothetical protein
MLRSVMIQVATSIRVWQHAFYISLVAYQDASLIDNENQVVSAATRSSSILYDIEHIQTW